jgi:hypothetical protein
MDTHRKANDKKHKKFDICNSTDASAEVPTSGGLSDINLATEKFIRTFDNTSKSAAHLAILVPL